jgi:hypothetical protein
MLFQHHTYSEREGNSARNAKSAVRTYSLTSSCYFVRSFISSFLAGRKKESKQKKKTEKDQQKLKKERK